VNAEHPEAWEEIPISPVLDVRPLIEQKLLIFADFIRLAAYGSAIAFRRAPKNWPFSATVTYWNAWTRLLRN